ncbi:hypothetical protein EYV94_10290 [Puteibacter caeruleilacunae]|nr:hypothetical protein EYV94_10290 [Puteibacter caeruleilacunae]
MTMRKILLLVVAAVMTLGLTTEAQNSKNEWKETFKKELQLMGHRNWILIADAAYPLQSNPGIKTIVCDESHVSVIKEVLKEIEKSTHVRGKIYLDKEIDFVSEKHAPGIEKYRKQLKQILAGADVKKVLHEELIGKLDEASNVFNVLVIKTPFALPYTSVFFELDCGYWSGEGEQDMRKAMEK